MNLSAARKYKINGRPRAVASRALPCLSIARLFPLNAKDVSKMTEETTSISICADRLAAFIHQNYTIEMEKIACVKMASIGKFPPAGSQIYYYYCYHHG